MYVDMAKRPSQRAPSPERRAKSTIPARLRAAALAAFPDPLGSLRASAARLRARGRLEIGLARRLRQRRRRRRLAIRLGLSRRFGLGWGAARHPRSFLLEPDAQPGELPFDFPDRLLALVEPLPLRLRERELLHCLAFALLGLRDLLGELTRAVGPRRRGSRSRGAPAPLPAGDLEPKLLELLLARSDILCVLAQPPLHVLDLRERLLVAAPHVQRVGHQDEASLSNRLVASINGHTS